MRIVEATLFLERFFGTQGRFPVMASGLPRIPSPPLMIVSNHSGGSTVLDCLGLAYAWYSQFEGTRPLHFLAHEILLATRITGPFFDRVGVLKTSKAVAREVLMDWRRDVVVLPGGDQDTWRPYKHRFQVNFAGRVGYAKIALESRAPVLPVANAGAHETLIVLTDGARIAERLRLHDLFRIDVFPIHLSLPWLIGVGPWPHLPFPRPLRYRFGQPVPLPEGLEPGKPVTKEQIRDYDRRVRAALQSLLDDLAAEEQAMP